ncbi:IS200/IS605 family transposase [Algoriphagus namhaensis]
MSSYRQMYYHAMFHTKRNEPTLKPEATEIYNYMWGIVKNKNSKLYQINGTEDHIHLLVDIHPSIAVADFMQDLKSFSSSWIKKSGNYPAFKGWASGYGCFTSSVREKDNLIKYIKRQVEHHKKESFEEEYRRILKENEVEFDEKYFLK